METIVTIGLAAILLAVYFTVLNSVFFLRRMQYHVQAANFVQEEIEVLRALAYDELIDRTDGDFLGIPIVRGDWAVADIDAPQGNAMAISSAETAVVEETGLMVVPGNYREDFTYSAKVRVDSASPGGWGAGIAFRYRDAENHYRFRFSSGGIALDKIEHGTKTTLWSQGTSFSTGTWYKLEVIASGADITIKRDDITLTTYSDATFSVGDLALIALNDALAAYDNVSVTETATTTWNFESETAGELPNEWKRMNYNDLPAGFGELTISDYLGDSGIKEINVEIGWLDGFFVKHSTGTTLIAE